MTTVSLDLRTLRDYVPAYVIHADCPACRHHAVVDSEKAARLVGWDVPLLELRDRLTCSSCGHRGCEVRIVHAGRPAGVA